MSDRPPMFPPHVEPVPVDQVLAELEAAERAVGRLGHRFVGDDNERRKQWLMYVVGELRRLGDAVRSGEVVPDPAGPAVGEVELPPRRLGEHTREVQSRVVGNRGAHARPW